MDRTTAKLRKRLEGKQIEYLDIYHGYQERFTVSDVQGDDRGIRVIKGDSDFQKVYIPDHAVSELIEKGYCSYKSDYDTKTLEYRIRICESL